jgi:hypothetical protein
MFICIVDLCKLRCFPPVALAWDSVSGLHIIPNIYSEIVVVDSSPAFWDLPEGTDRTTVMILVRFYFYVVRRYINIKLSW